MIRKGFLLLVILAGLLLLAACAGQPVVTPTPAAALPNPASVHCEQNGGTLKMVTDADGNVSGVCVFADGSQCDEWAFFRGECQPGGAPATLPPASETEGGWKRYQNTELGYTFAYPADASLVKNDDPLGGLTISGPEQDGEHWPAITINHPRDREEYRPPENTDLLQWLTDHHLLGEQRQEDVTIAGTTAIHFRHARSPQSFAFDTYFFAHAGQLYQIIIGHPGDREDWDLYNHFLASFKFGA